ncbi:MAG: hypothetical protein DWP97_10225 [Calditrichaeota bacterium]|nr:MAG: hypothetical protein DWP97_10225 [Calditrichota bacterium]
MKHIYLLLILIALIGCSGGSSDTQSEPAPEVNSQAKVDSFFNDYFVFLDSVADSLGPELKQERLRASVMELEFLSGLSAHGKRTDKSYTGFKDIDPADVRMWKDWYSEHK